VLGKCVYSKLKNVGAEMLFNFNWNHVFVTTTIMMVLAELSPRVRAALLLLSESIGHYWVLETPLSGRHKVRRQFGRKIMAI